MGKHTIFVATNPNRNVPLGVPGVTIGIGEPELVLFETGDPNNVSYIQSPTTGSTVNFVANKTSRVATYSILGTGTLAALTYTFTNGWIDQQTIYVYTQVAVTAITNTGANVNTTPPVATTATAGQRMGFVWTVSNSKWTQFQ